MQEQITLSNSEKKHYFFYLLGMLIFAVLLLGVIFLYQKNSPFKNMDNEMIDTKRLMEKAKFESNFKEISNVIDSTYVGIKNVDPDKDMEISLTDEISMKVNQINDFPNQYPSSDKRLIAYKQIGYFNKMFIDDKNHVIKNNNKINEYNNRYDECTTKNSNLK